MSPPTSEKIDRSCHNRTGSAGTGAGAATATAGAGGAGPEQPITHRASSETTPQRKPRLGEERTPRMQAARTTAGHGTEGRPQCQPSLLRRERSWLEQLHAHARARSEHLVRALLA